MLELKRWAGLTSEYSSEVARILLNMPEIQMAQMAQRSQLTPQLLRQNVFYASNLDACLALPIVVISSPLQL
jgi:hypothetical protein